MYGDLSFDEFILAEDEKYWDAAEEEDDGIPRRYGTIKVQIREGESE